MKFISRLVLFIFVQFLVETADCQCSTTGPNNGSSFANDNSLGTLTWSNTANAATPNNQYASAGSFLTLLASVNTEYITAENLGFNIPATATICGIEVDVERFATGLTNIFGVTVATVSDNSVRFIKNGTIQGDELKSGTDWTGSNTYVSYGLSDSSWGISNWLPADVNSANFGVAISANLSALASVTLTANIDHIRITVFYLNDPILGLSALEKFNVSIAGSANQLSWSVQPNNHLANFMVQRSIDGLNWTDIAHMPATSGNEYYKYADLTPPAGTSFYRLRLEDKDQDISYSASESLNRSQNSPMILFPDPASDIINIKNLQPFRLVSIRDAQGRLVKILGDGRLSTTTSIDISGLARGMYLLQTDSLTTKFFKN